MALIKLTDTVTIDEDELDLAFIRGSGPGGQNVNKVASTVQLRFDARKSPSLPNDVSIRLQKLAGSKLTLDGVIVFTAGRFRTQEANRRDAIERLCEMIAKAAVAPVKRRPTKPSKAAKQKRMDAKSRRSTTKSMRSRPISGD